MSRCVRCCTPSWQVDAKRDPLTNGCIGTAEAAGRTWSAARASFHAALPRPIKALRAGCSKTPAFSGAESTGPVKTAEAIFPRSITVSPIRVPHRGLG